ncbi:CopD family protein [Wenzhouxiangella limi]|uniref:Copper resistance protein D domain-containing protein n=1 Tax=Wenzhouxiangella limi TaxID=2707351 RepID=A0A845UZM7_9GAMM|nr:CopD family protein [Wenzhouxiangella limi]NDY96218.1 hypothetical protein [Wenzhouxiangella limi]
MPSSLVSALIALHAVAATVWVGGMFLAYTAVRPAAGAALEPPERGKLWLGIFARFFPWVWISILVLLGTGFALIFGVYGGMAGVGGHVHIMLLAGVIMMGLFAYLYLLPYQHMRRAVAAADWAEAGRRLGRIRSIIAINLTLGLLTIAIGSGGPLW